MDSLYFSKRYNRYIRSYKNDSQSGTFSPDLTWSLTTLPWVSPFHNLLHALTSWQLISHAFSQSQTPKKFWRCSHLLPGKISIDSQLNPKRTLSLRVWLHSFSLPWWPLHATKCADLSLLFLFFEMTAITEPKSWNWMWCLLLQLLSHTCNYVTSNTHNPHWRYFPLNNLGHLTTFYPFTTIITSHVHDNTPTDNHIQLVFLVLC